MDDLKKKLFNEYMQLDAASKMYDHVIENSKMCYSPSSSYMQNLVLHQAKLHQDSGHSLDKSKSDQCLACPNVLTCQVKCEEFSKDSKKS